MALAMSLRIVVLPVLAARRSAPSGFTDGCEHVNDARRVVGFIAAQI